MIRFLGVRLLFLIPTLLGALIVAFLLLYVAPGDPVQAMVGERADSATNRAAKEPAPPRRSLPRQFVRYAGGAVTGDLGTSYITQRPILQDLVERFPATLRLAAAAMLFASITGMSIGVYGAWRPGSVADRIAYSALTSAFRSRCIGWD